jgi:hypothetical protein
MQHRERNDGGELGVGELHVRPIAFHNGHVRVFHSIAEWQGEHGVYLQAREAWASLSEELGGEPRTGSNFQDMRTQVYPVEDSWNYLLRDDALPAVR